MIKKMRNKYAKHISVTISFLLGALVILGPFLVKTTVYAAFDLIKIRTIGELIITLFAGAGTAITNPIVVPQVYQAGNYTMQSLVENDILNIDGHPEYTDNQIIERLGTGDAFNLDVQGFRELMSTNWASMRELQVDSVLRFNEIANTDSVYGAIDNIGQIVRNYAEYGYLGFENMIAIVENPFTAVRVSMETIRNAIIDVYGNNINSSVPIDGKIPQQVINYTEQNTGTKIVFTRYGGYDTGGLYRYRYAVVPNFVKVAAYKRSDYTIGLRGYQNKGYYTVNQWESVGNTVREKSSVTIRPGQVAELIPIDGVGNWGIPDGTLPLFLTLQEADNYISVWEDTNYENPAQDIIGTIGNITENQGETGITQGQGIDIIPQSEYEDFMNEANENTQNEDYAENADIYDDLINNYINEIPQPEPEPIIPVQPTTFPPRPTINPEEQITGMQGATPGITDYFPFCIPIDMVNLIKHFNTAQRTAPKWNLAIVVPSMGINERIEIDLEEFDDVAEISRNVQYILFILGLMLITRKIIGAKG